MRWLGLLQILYAHLRLAFRESRLRFRLAPHTHVLDAVDGGVERDEEDEEGEEGEADGHEDVAFQLLLLL